MINTFLELIHIHQQSNQNECNYLGTQLLHEWISNREFANKKGIPIILPIISISMEMVLF